MKALPKWCRSQPARDPVQQPRERELQRIFGPHDEGGDSDVDDPDRADARDDVEPPLESRRDRAWQHEQAEAEPTHQQRERREVEPADDVLAPGRSRRRRMASVGGGAFMRTPKV